MKTFMLSPAPTDFRPEIEDATNKRKHQAEFVQRGVAAIRETQRTGNGVPASEVLARLEVRLLAARQALAQRGR